MPCGGYARRQAAPWIYDSAKENSTLKIGRCAHSRNFNEVWAITSKRKPRRNKVQREMKTSVARLWDKEEYFTVVRSCIFLGLNMPESKKA
jgi:hypothetical protein